MEHRTILYLSSLNIVGSYFGSFKEYKLITWNRTETGTDGTSTCYYDVYKFYPKFVLMMLNGKLVTKTYETEPAK